MVKEIITDVDLLNERSEECDIRKNNRAVRDTISNLKDTMKENNLLALSGVQIGAPIRIVMLNINDSYKALCQPFITEASGFTLSRETDPSFPGKTFIVPRYNKITVYYLNPLGKTESKSLLGLASFLLQQQVDHLEGILVNEIGLEIDSDFDEATEDEKAEVIKAFLDSLDVKYNQLQESIEEDPEAKKINDAIKFMSARDSGKIQVEEIELPEKEENKDNKDE